MWEIYSLLWAKYVLFYGTKCIHLLKFKGKIYSLLWGKIPLTQNCFPINITDKSSKSFKIYAHALFDKMFKLEGFTNSFNFESNWELAQMDGGGGCNFPKKEGFSQM